MTTILLIRHGTTDAVGHQLVGWLPGVGLNQRGRDEAARLGRQLAAVRLDAVYSSPLERALLTARAVAEGRGLEIVVRDRLGEVRFGEWTGRLIDGLNEPEWRDWNTSRSTARAPGGETFLEVQARMVAELMEIARAHPGGNVAAVSHADALRAALLALLGAPADFVLRLDIRPASVSVVQLADGIAPRVVSVNIPVDGFDDLVRPVLS